MLFIYDKEEETTLKIKIMDKSGILLDYIDFHEICYNNNQDDYVHAMVIDDKRIQNKEDLVFIHGMAASSICYYGAFNLLSKHFRIIAIDIPGMGCSSRNDINFKNHYDTEKYFIDRIKNALDKFNLTKFTLIGHSMGGYISGLFSIKFPEIVKNLILLSPVGISSSYYKIKYDGVKEDLLCRLFYKIGSPPSMGYKFFNILSSFILDRFMDVKLKDSWLYKDKDNFQNLKDFLNLIMRNVCCSEKAGLYLFDKDFRPYKPLTQHFKTIKDINILFFYGENDWNPKQNADDLKQLIPSVQIETVPESGHNMFFENYFDKVCEKIINYCIYDKK